MLAVMENCGPYNGNNTNRNARMNTQMARAAMGNGGLYKGNGTNRRHSQRLLQICQRLLSTTSARCGAATTTDTLANART